MPTDVHFCRDIDFNLATGGLNEFQVLEQFVVGSESYCNLYLMVMMILNNDDDGDDGDDEDHVGDDDDDGDDDAAWFEQYMLELEWF